MDPKLRFFQIIVVIVIVTIMVIVVVIVIVIAIEVKLVCDHLCDVVVWPYTQQCITFFFNAVGVANMIANMLYNQL